MKKSRLILVSATALAVMLTVSIPALAAETTETSGMGHRFAFSVNREQRPEVSAEKPEAVDILAMLESGEFGGMWGQRGNAGELTDEQKAEMAEKRAEIAENGGFGAIWGNRGNAGELTDEQKAEMAEKRAEMLAEKLAAGEITQEEYDAILAAMESGEFGGMWGKRGNAGELTDEQKAEFAAKRTEMLAEKLAAGEITQEEYDAILAAVESGEFGGMWGKRGNVGELTDEQKAEMAEKRAEFTENGGFRGNRGNARELTDEQKAEMAEKWTEAAESGRTGVVLGNRGNAMGWSK